jgi:hypothetical protein
MKTISSYELTLKIIFKVVSWVYSKGVLNERELKILYANYFKQNYYSKQTNSTYYRPNTIPSLKLNFHWETFYINHFQSFNRFGNQSMILAGLR